MQAQTALSGNASASNSCGTTAQTGGVSSNTSVGCSTGNASMTGGDNTLVGDLVGTAITTGTANTCVGYSVGVALTSGTNNTFLGAGSGASTTTVSANTFVGAGAGLSNVSGATCSFFGTGAGQLANASNNTFMGYHAGYNCAVTNNVAVGANALYTLGGGYAWGNSATNVAVGNNALYNNLTYANSAMGDHALYNNTTGIENSALGYEAGYYNTTGSNNTFLGYNTGYTSSSTGSQNTFVGNGATENGDNTNATAIGYGASASGSNYVAVGNTSVGTIAGQVNFSMYSDKRVKENIQENVPGLKFISKLHPVTYHFNIDKENEILGIKKDESNQKGKYDVEKITFSGFLAQEVEKAASDVGYDFSGVVKPQNDKSLYGLRYSEFVVPMVKAMQEQQSMIEDQQRQIAQLTQLVNAMGGLNNSAVNDASRQAVQLSNATAVVLNQNVPNPFAEQTIINYSIPQTAVVAQILFYDMAGQLIQTSNITTRGAGQLNVFANDLSNGNYSYTLVIDGKIVDTKKMIRQQ